MRTRGPRAPSSDELDLWQQVMQHVRPLGRGAAATPAAPAAVPPPPPPSVPAPVLPTAAVRPQQPRPAPGPSPANLDKRNRQRLLRGQMTISARLDLHGMDQESAHLALDAFVHREHARGARCVLVITGVGIRSGGVLRQLTPRWLDTPSLAAKVLAYGSAKPRHGGNGALYVLLRRIRTA